ncbi:MAG: hypothetical protein MJZ65_01345 [Paludibacteraceae bacterium]|nr:hypothetical protein [Paludibacteraceae bacterium]
MKMLKIMNNMIKNKKMCVLTCLLLCVSVGVVAQIDGAAAPSAGFGSTSTMMGSGSAYSSTPTINSYGMAGDPGYVANRGRLEDREDAGTPGGEQTDGPVPVGDAVPFLLLLAAGYAFLARRKRA